MGLDSSTDNQFLQYFPKAFPDRSEIIIIIIILLLWEFFPTSVTW